MVEHHFQIPKTARYYTHGSFNEQTTNVWVVCHGYGQLAGYFLKNFENLDPNQHVVFAPEGLSRFYLKGFEGRIGATWMTKEDRLADIDDYVNYLDELHQEVIKPYLSENIRYNVLGFSQGAATVSRWLTLGRYAPADNLILWAGLFPPDLPFDHHLERLKSLNIFLVHGQDDPYMTEEKLNERTQMVEEQGITYHTKTFDGEHRVPHWALRELMQSFPEYFNA